MTKTTKLFIISGLIVLVVGIIITLAIVLTRNKDTEPEPVNITETEQQPEPQLTPELVPIPQEHRENDQPTEIEYYENGDIWYKAWYLNG